jgi:hypothetical protein
MKERPSMLHDDLLRQAEALAEPITALRRARSASASEEGFGDIDMVGPNLSHIVTQATRQLASHS